MWAWAMLVAALVSAFWWLLKGLWLKAHGSMQPLAYIPAHAQIVVARYEEDVSWLVGASVSRSSFIQPSPIIVYNKGKSVPACDAATTIVIDLPNVGREAHTFLHHIVENYDALAPVTVFTQGYPFDHAPDWCAALPTLVESAFAFGAAGCAPVALPVVEEWLGALGTRPPRVSSPSLWALSGRQLQQAPLPFIVPRVFWWGAQFAATAECIRSIPRANWAAMRDALADNGSNPREAHFMERFWKALLLESSAAK